MSEPLLAARDIHTYYGDSYVIQGVSLDVLVGQIVTLLAETEWAKPPSYAR